MPVPRTSFINSDSVPKLVNVRCVYQLTFSNGRFYIGSTNNLQKRLTKWREKIKAGIYNKKIKFFVKDKFDCKVDVLEYVENRTDLMDREDFYIKKNIVNPMLLNRAKGAYFSTKHAFTSKEKKALSGRVFTPERCKEISDRLKGRVISPEWAAKIKEAERVRVGKKVNQYTIDGVLVNSFRCIGDASEKLNISDKSIRKVAYRQKKTTHGFVFRLAERDQSIDKVVDNRRKVALVNAKGKILKRYDSIKDAAASVGAHHSQVSMMCYGKAKTVRGKIFKFISN